MALFFDLGIPYQERDGGGSSSENKARKDARLRAVVRAMELGYTAVAYDRPFRGVLSDAERCKIAPFPLSSLLKVAPSLAASAALHRDLLGTPSASPFRQYTRLTISVHGAAAVVSLNGSALLRTYDLVALRPLNQEAFDKACESSEVDIIAMDFSQKLPFRLKLPLIKLAIKRGLYFEITYSHLIADVHIRRQILSDAKLLSDWTRGKNLIFSSAASTANEVRGPHDVANLAVFLLGLSLERAKYAVSQNCRSLVANALRKKHFYKETIRIERIIPDEESQKKKFWFDDCSEWDPISSEKGDLPSLDNITEVFSSISRQPFTSNSIDFMSISNVSPFLLSENTNPKKPGSYANPNDIPSSAATAAMQQVAVSMPLKITGQENPTCEAVVSTHDTALLIDSKESCQSVELDECLKNSDEFPMASSTGTLPSTIATSKDDGFLQSDACPTSSVALENEPSHRFMEAQQSSDQSDNHLTETSNAEEPMGCVPDNDDPTSKSCYVTSSDADRNNDSILPSDADLMHLAVLENKKSNMFVEIQKRSHQSGNQVSVTSNDAAKFMNCITQNDDPTPNSCNYTYNDGDFLRSNANATSLAVIEKKPSNMFMEVQKTSDQSAAIHVIEASNDAAEIMDCISDVAADQITLDDEGPCFTDFMEKKMMKVQVVPRILQQELKEKNLNDHCIPLQRSLIQPLLSDQGAGPVTSGEDHILKDDFKETKEKEVCSSEVDAQAKENTKTVEEEIQSLETKSGRKRKERIFYPAYSLPFKFKPMLFKKKHFNPKRTRKYLFDALQYLC
ncbi:hypothetical protein Cni_G18000 [Canna indica]|uniref:Uncharacterized protein n=1 Tax=Canna indica TaxID=4628 RepID=A0AAQ3KJR2_9LILI|nr:hypothetical protein Cni_G18000 [Canna indica]